MLYFILILHHYDIAPFINITLVYMKHFDLDRGTLTYSVHVKASQSPHVVIVRSLELGSR